MGPRRRGPGLVRTVARTAVISGTATAVSNNVSRRQYERAQDNAIEQNPEQVQPISQAPPANDTDAQIAEIQKFAALKDQGIISEEEFSAKKQQILGL